VPLEGPIEPGGLANPIDGESMTSDDPSEAETRAAIGPKADLYLRKWQAIPGGGFNWAAFLLRPLDVVPEDVSRRGDPLRHRHVDAGTAALSFSGDAAGVRSLPDPLHH
jgi:hypothetical protein